MIESEAPARDGHESNSAPDAHASCVSTDSEPLGAHFFGHPAFERGSVAELFAERTGFHRTRLLSTESGNCARIMDRIHAGRHESPIILRGLAADWPALNRWDRDYVLHRWGDVRVKVARGLPAHGVPFLAAASEVRREISVRDFWKAMEEERCWLEEQPVSRFPGLQDDLRMADLMGTRSDLALKLWVGRSSKSGLHFDPTDNLLAMIRGYKFVAMASLREGRRLYPFLGSVMKSRLDVERPDFTRFPRAADVEILVGRIAPGDVLYIPAGWWHYLSSPADGYQMSVTCPFGRELSLSFLARRLLGLGPRHAARVVEDFLVYGLLGRPCAVRFHDVPNGLQLYRKLRAVWRSGGDGGTEDDGAEEVGCPRVIDGFPLISTRTRAPAGPDNRIRP